MHKRKLVLAATATLAVAGLGAARLFRSAPKPAPEVAGSGASPAGAPARSSTGAWAGATPGASRPGSPPGTAVQSAAVQPPRTVVLDATVPAQQLDDHAASSKRLFDLTDKQPGRARFETSVAAFTVTSELMADGMVYDRLTLPDAHQRGAEGEPSLPAVGKEMLIDTHAKVSVQIDHIDWHTVEGRFNLAPMQTSLIDSQPAPPFIKSEAAYAIDGFVGDLPVTLLDTYTIRGKTFANVGITPFQWNPTTHELRVAQNIQWSLVPDMLAAVPPRAPGLEPSPLSEDVVSEVLDLQNLITSDLRPSVLLSGLLGGADYLIIVDDALVDYAMQMAKWKYSKGLHVAVARTSTMSGAVGTPPTADQVRNYIANAYENWTPSPQYVLLIGGVDQIPSGPSSYKIPNDLYYATVDGTDYQPDLAIGRLPCTSTLTCTNMVGKALAWEQSPPASSAPFWNNVLLAAEFEDDDSNDVEDRWFVETAEAFRRYYNLQWPSINVNTVYIDNKFGPTANSRALKHNSHSILNTSSSAFQMPASGDTASGSSSGSTTRFVTTGNGNAEVVAGINAGAALVLHRDHGGYGGWGLPAFGASDATALTNGNLTPLFLSFECYASAIDHDTLAMNMLKHTNNGAHAVIGASRTSYSGYNDWMAHGFLNCFTGNVYDRLSTQSGFRSISYAGNPWSGRSDYGGLLNCAKKTMYDMEGAGAGDNEKEYELFHLYGDPETSIRTNAPAALSATSTNLAISYKSGNGGAGQSTVSFTIKNPKAQYTSSQAALTEDPDRLHFFPLEGPVLASTGVAAPAPTSAPASITVNWGTGTSGENRYIASALDHLNLTVTSRNGIPYQARVPITVDAQAPADYQALQSQFVSYWNTSGKYATNSGAPCLSTYEVARTLTHTNGAGFASSTYQCAVACPSQQIAADAWNNPVCTCAADGSCPADQECNAGLCAPCGEIDEMVCSTGAPCRDGVQVGNICRAIAANTPTGCSSGAAYMLPGEGLYENQYMLSCDGRFRLYMQGDGNLVLSMKDSAGNFTKTLWTTQTNGVTMELVVMQGDGNLVLYAPDFNPPWATHTDGNDGVHLKLFNDGNMKIYSSAAGIVWTSNTGGH